jgi:hypothetical protein
VSARLTDRSFDRTDDRTGWRVPANQTEQILAAAISEALKGAGCVPKSDERPSTTHTVESAAATALSDSEQSALLNLVERAHVGLGHVDIHLQPRKVAALLNISVADVPDALRAFSAPFHRRRRGVETKLIFGHQAPAVDPVLLKWVARGWVWWREIQTGKASVHEIAKREKVTARFISMHLELAFMAPDVIASVVDGRHPSFMNAQALRTLRLPPTWAEQRSALAELEVTRRR